MVMATTINLNAATEPDIVIKNFDPGQDGVLYQDIQNNITVKAMNANKQSLQYSIPCLDFNGEFTGLTLSKTGTPAYAYIDIVNQGERIIEKVEYIGNSANPSGSSFAIAAVSLDGNTFPENLMKDNPAFPPPPSAQPISQIINFSLDYNEACSGNNVFAIPQIAYRGLPVQPNNRELIEDFDKQVKIIRLIWGETPFAGINVSNTNYAPNIFGIKIFLVNTGTTINNETDDNNQIQSTINNGVINFSQKVDMELVSVNGNKLLSKYNTSQVDIKHLEKGIYIIKAVKKNSEHVYVKKISLVK